MSGADWERIKTEAGGTVDVRRHGEDDLARFFDHVPDDEVADAMTRLDAATNNRMDDRRKLAAVLKAIGTVGDVALRLIKAGV